MCSHRTTRSVRKRLSEDPKGVIGNDQGLPA
jgi:hypothetical protein